MELTINFKQDVLFGFIYIHKSNAIINIFRLLICQLINGYEYEYESNKHSISGIKFKK